MLDFTSSSSDEDDELNFLKRTTPKLTSKGIKTAGVLSGSQNDFKRFKLASSRQIELPPSWGDGKYVKLLEESKELLELHAKDEQEAMEKLAKKDEFKHMVTSKLIDDISGKESYIEYLDLNKQSEHIYDWFYFGKSEVDLHFTDDEVTTLPFVSWNTEVITELNHSVLQKVELGGIEVGVSFIDDCLGDLGVRKEYSCITKVEESMYEIDCKQLNQDVDLILLKLSKLVMKVVPNDYNQAIWTKLVRVIGFSIMDMNVYKYGDLSIMNQMINTIISWHQDRLSMIEIWMSLSDDYKLVFRILSIIDDSQLKRLFAFKLFTGNCSDHIDNELINESILSQTQLFNQSLKEHNVKEISNIYIRFKALFNCLDFENIKDKQIYHNLNHLKRQLPITSLSIDQELLRSILSLQCTFLNQFNNLEYHLFS